MSQIDVDVAVIGAGVVGLACGLRLAERGARVCILEKDTRAGHGTSTRNSGVIHAGIYYPKDSLKARLCVRGREQLYEFCAAHHVPHERCGKLIVVTDEHTIDALERLRARGLDNGVDRLELVDRAFIQEKEPHIRAVAALWSPDTGIVETEALVRAMARACRDADVALVLDSPLRAAQIDAACIRLETPHETIVAAEVVNAAGLHADEVSRALGATPFTIYPCRGEYAELAPSRRHLVKGLVYPLPGDHSLGVHFTRTTWGSVRLGPTAPLSGGT